MGGKPDHSLKSNRPESGGADGHGHYEGAGVLDEHKEQFAQNEHEKRVAEANAQRDESDKNRPTFPQEFSIDNPRNPDPYKK